MTPELPPAAWRKSNPLCQTAGKQISDKEDIFMRQKSNSPGRKNMNTPLSQQPSSPPPPKETPVTRYIHPIHRYRPTPYFRRVPLSSLTRWSPFWTPLPVTPICWKNFCAVRKPAPQIRYKHPVPPFFILAAICTSLFYLIGTRFPSGCGSWPWMIWIS